MTKLKDSFLLILRRPSDPRSLGITAPNSRMADEEQNACKTSYNKRMLKACIQPIRFAQVGFLDIWLDDSRQCRNFFLRSFWSRIYDSPNNIVSAFGSKKERKIHSNNRRNGCIILEIIADVLALRCTLDSTCMPRVCCLWVQRYEISIFAFHRLNMQILRYNRFQTAVSFSSYHESKSK